MAEFCKECFLKEYKLDSKKEKIIVSKEVDICEVCGQVKPAVIRVVYKNPIRRFMHKYFKMY